MNKVLFSKDYSDESLYDLAQDMEEVFDSDTYHRIPSDDDGFKQGTFSVTVIWKKT